MENQIITQLIRMCGMIIIGVSTLFLHITDFSIFGFISFLIVWTLGFFIYDLHKLFEAKE